LLVYILYFMIMKYCSAIDKKAQALTNIFLNDFIIIITLSDCITPQGVYSKLNKLFTYTAGRTDIKNKSSTVIKG